MTSKSNQAGQVSLFLGITLAVVMALVAFIINVGMFVKAKINLQNAVDAAAWAGAATQARQLTNMAYLNWEMRNTYKEWMFKYYVLGTLGVDALQGPPNPRTNFRLQPFYTSGSQFDPNVYDRFNVPSICIHYGSPHNICGTAMVPGLPRFNSVGLPSISEYHETLINAIVREKASDCSSRTKINFGAAMAWALGTGNANLFPEVPQIAGHRTGAWVESTELALRMRNLEMIANTPPVAEGVCVSGGECAVNVEQLANSPLHERTSKAFWSAFRNLSGGDDEFAKTFVLKELPPTPLVASPASLSGFLIPDGGALTKHYVDLQAYPLNLVTFYTTFVSDSGIFKNSGTNTVRDEARCAGSKTALPIPGYIMGLVKNPEVMTYYAVKGEAKYVGLFFPFASKSGIKLTAYAAAKPFGGKIGPRLFSIDSGGSAVRARNESSATRTGPYVSAFNIGASGATWGPLLPMPFDPNFWVRGPSHALGGTPKSGNEIYFGVPNLIYDFEDIGDIAHMNSGNIIEVLQPAGSFLGGQNVVETMGLYDGKQYQKFRSNLASASGIVLSAEEVERSLNSVRRPTHYEAMNYLIPAQGVPDDPNRIDTQQIIAPGKNQYSLHAPLFGPGLLFQNSQAAANAVSDYLDYIKPATQKYLDSLKKIADDMRTKSSTQSRGRDAYLSAADTIHKTPLTPNDCTSLSMAQIFHQHFNGTSEVCQIVPIKQSLEQYFSKRASSEESYKSFYIPPYTPPSNLPTSDLMAGYFPGPRQGATQEGRIESPFPGVEDRLSKRNYYSTKFFAVEKITQGGGNPYGRIPLYLERNDLGYWPTDLQGVNIRNTLPVAELREFGTPPPH